jgi:hypothetical protein
MIIGLGHKTTNKKGYPFRTGYPHLKFNWKMQCFIAPLGNYKQPGLNFYTETRKTQKNPLARQGSLIQTINYKPN